MLIFLFLTSRYLIHLLANTVESLLLVYIFIFSLFEIISLKIQSYSLQIVFITNVISQCRVFTSKIHIRLRWWHHFHYKVMYCLQFIIPAQRLGWVKNITITWFCKKVLIIVSNDHNYSYNFFTLFVTNVNLIITAIQRHR